MKSIVPRTQYDGDPESGARLSAPSEFDLCLRDSLLVPSVRPTCHDIHVVETFVLAVPAKVAVRRQLPAELTVSQLLLSLLLDRLIGLVLLLLGLLYYWPSSVLLAHVAPLVCLSLLRIAYLAQIVLAQGDERLTALSARECLL